MLRELRQSDAESVAALFRSVFGDQRPIDAAQIVSWIRNEELEPEWLQVLELDGRVVGYGDIVVDAREVALDVAAAPEQWDMFFEWAEERARAEGVPRVRILLPAGHETEGLAARRGYRLWRSGYTMEAVLDEPPPELPDRSRGNRVPFRIARATKRNSVRHLTRPSRKIPFFHEATPAHFREFYLRARGFDPSLWLLAWAGEELAGFVLSLPERAGEDRAGLDRVARGSRALEASWNRGGAPSRGDPRTARTRPSAGRPRR